MARSNALNLPDKLEVRPVYLLGVEGHLGRRNDALFKPALPSSMNTDLTIEQGTLVFFGGDVQNFIYLMDQKEPNIQYQRWCLEATACRLGEDFPSHHIVVIKPSRIMFDHVSCFDNFVEGSFIGIPNHMYYFKSLPHLEKLLQKISKAIKKMPSEKLFKMLLKRQEEEDYLSDDDKAGNVWQYKMMSKVKRKMLFKWKKSLRLHKYPLTLVAFSKGCVVLNQFLYEFHYAKRLEPNATNESYKIIDRIAAMYWLDGSHPGRHNVYLTSRGLLRTLHDLNIEVHVHLSNYQMDDISRPWIKQQCREFVEFLMGVNAKLILRRHFNPAPDLTSHFNVLMNFKSMESVPIRYLPAAPSVLPNHTSPHIPPAPVLTTDERDQPLERAVAHRDILGVALVSPHDTPYLALQMILRRPRDGAENGSDDSDQNSAGSTSGEENSGTPEPNSSDDNSSDSADINPNSRFHTPFNFVARNPLNSNPLNFLPQDPSTVAQNLSFPLQIPYNGTAQIPSFSGPSTSGAQEPSTSAANAQDLYFSADSDPSTSAASSLSTSAAPGPSTFITTAHFPSPASGPSTSAASGPSTSAASGPSTFAVPGPSTFAAPGPSTSAAPDLSTCVTTVHIPSPTSGRSTSAASGPSTLAVPGPSTFAVPGPSTFATPGPSTYAASSPSTSAAAAHDLSTSTALGPSTSAALDPSTSAAEIPSTSAAQIPSTSAAQIPSTSGAQIPSTSGAQNAVGPSNAQTNPGHRFTVLTSKKSIKINFTEDTEAARAYLSANFFELEGPVIAIPNSINPTGINVYTPVNEMYTPVTNGEGSSDSSAAATPRPRTAAVRPAIAPHAAIPVASNAGYITIPTDITLSSSILRRIDPLLVTSRTTQTLRDDQVIPLGVPAPSTSQAAAGRSASQATAMALRPRARRARRAARGNNGAPYSLDGRATSRYNLRSSR